MGKSSLRDFRCHVRLHQTFRGIVARLIALSF
jgi:hypothetical protein